jgi:hypothetical protein
MSSTNGDADLADLEARDRTHERDLRSLEAAMRAQSERIGELTIEIRKCQATTNETRNAVALLGDTVNDNHKQLMNALGRRALKKR